MHHQGELVPDRQQLDFDVSAGDPPGLVIDAFVTYAAHDRGWSPNSIRRYRTVLRSLALEHHPLTATTTDLEHWWAGRTQLSKASRANELAVLRSFYSWATRFDHRVDDPTRRLDFPKLERRVPRPIGQTQLDQLLGELTTDHLDLRRAFAIGAYAGLRVSEVAALDWTNFDLDARRIYVFGKGAKERVFGLSPVLLDKLLPVVRGNVVTAGGRAYTADQLQRRINRFMDRAGIDNTFHDLRKRAATLAMARVPDPQAVAEAFGWANLQTAQHYRVVGSQVLDDIAAAVV
ncbi:tyrosine-type recombinase/integrase [Nocardioides marmoraquaticus]